MLTNPDYQTARDILLAAVEPVDAEAVPLEWCTGRILARALTAAEDMPVFDRSPYDGYAVRAADTAPASPETPVTLAVNQEIPAGAIPIAPVGPGQAAKILTGAPIPPGADAVVKFEKTRFDRSAATLFSPLRSGDNIVRRGEDVGQGEILAPAGTVIDAGLAGTLAAQGQVEPLVYRRVTVGLISTGSEICEACETPPPGMIRNTNRFTLAAAPEKNGFEPHYLGLARDDRETIAALIAKGLEVCDAVILTGGVSVGDYDLTPDAMELAGAELLFRGVAMKPGMACAYGMAKGKPVMGLSGNPASSLLNFYAVALPALRRLAGLGQPLPPELTVMLSEGFPKKSPLTRFLLGTLSLENGQVRIHLSPRQGNAIVSGAIGCNALAIIPAGSGPVSAETRLKGILL